MRTNSMIRVCVWHETEKNCFLNTFHSIFINFTEGTRKNLIAPLIRRYFRMLRITGGSVIISALIHIICITSYYSVYLWLHPDDPDRKAFYSAKVASKGVNVGGKVLGGGGIQTNYHKSYLFHVIKNFYMNSPKMFCVQFSILYLIVLYYMGFFREQNSKFGQEKKLNDEEDVGIEVKLESSSKMNPILRKRLIRNKRADYTIEESEEENENENDNLAKNEDDEERKDF